MHAELRFWLPRRLWLELCEVIFRNVLSCILVYICLRGRGLFPLPKKGEGENRVIIMAVMSDDDMCSRESF